LRQRILGHLPAIVSSIRRGAPPTQVAAMFGTLSGKVSTQSRCRRLILTFLRDEGLEVSAYWNEPILSADTSSEGAAQDGRVEVQAILRQSLQGALERDQLPTANWIWERLEQ
jgi:hypothetical protein